MRQRGNARGRLASKLGIMVLLAAGLSGCDLLGKEFRQVAGPMVQSGVTDIMNGVLNGLFAVFEPDSSE